ncbi:TIGR03503 family protein [Aliiglaciecola sp. CAU 1673]|uniref:TIGR03503 family protein n=1 Tax=Aliiglaciecola sp. CAU 1673 TaxID=3032595 RepID=UPI0023DC2061|nr:TIGR03503 family protein [Aliiglaciecola sp. CAU 1673]MDF2177572.1 TIGR03503 family protein [Aliiglaciecola sp. CAU 1673]
MNRFALVAFCLLISANLAAQEGTAAPAKEKAEQPSPISMLDQGYLNSIQLLKNRFRIDHEIDEVSLIFFREYGSSPIVLVRPDGSKIFQGRDYGDKVDWYDDATFDLIKLKKPMPGPWQAIGPILPNSRVMVMSDIELHVDPLPDLLLAGEILKLNAHLTNGGKPIENNMFRDVVQLTVEFVSTNNHDYTNFGADSQMVAQFEDNGMGMDEYPMDGVFSGQFNLAIADGQWKPIYRLITPMYTREVVGEPLVLHKTPINWSVVLDDGEQGRHQLIIDADRDLVDITTLLIDGKLRYPNGDVMSFSITEVNDKPRIYEVINYEYGVFRAKITAYGSTVNGREFILDVPEFSFLSEEPGLRGLTEETSAAGQEGEAALNDAEADSAMMDNAQAIDEAMPEDQGMAEFAQAPPEEKVDVVQIVLLANALVLCVGGGLIWWFMLRKRKPVKKAKGETTLKKPTTGVLSKIVRLLPSKKKKEKEAA